MFFSLESDEKIKIKTVLFFAFRQRSR